MIVNEAVQFLSFVNAAVFVKFAADRMCNFEVVMIVMSRIKSFVKLVVCDTVQQMLAVSDVARIVTVDDFAHQPEILFFGGCACAHLLHEAEIQAVGAVETDAVDVEFVDPEVDDIKEIVADLLVLEIQVDEFEAVSPCFVGESVVIAGVSAEPDSFVPSAVRGLFSFFLNVAEGKEFAAGVVEDTVYDDFDAEFVGFFYVCGKVRVVA